jgi:signal transduction histidine kinase
MLNAVNTSANQLSKTIDDLTNILVIKGTLNAEIKLIHLPDAFSNLSKIFFSILNEIGAQVSTDFSSAKIFFNETYLESILINLFSNAIKFRADGRKLLIHASSKNDEAGNTIFRFSDNGSGIDVIRHKERLFGLYQRFHNKVDGHGLGLYIIKSQIEALNGKIEIESDVEVGTTFIITFKKQLL